jgi:DNA-binding CsgD family transcriptional regulator
MIDLLWNSQVLGAMKTHACLTEEEEIVMTDWSKGRSIANTAMTHNMSTRTVDRVRQRIRKKYDCIQPYTGLPPRERTK